MVYEELKKELKKKNFKIYKERTTCKNLNSIPIWVAGIVEKDQFIILNSYTFRSIRRMVDFTLKHIENQIEKEKDSGNNFKDYERRPLDEFEVDY